MKENNTKKAMALKGHKKLLKEFEIINKSYLVILINNNINNWLVINEKATLEIVFPTLYPFEPPFIYIKSPIFTPDSKYISTKGALCLEYLTPSLWSPTISIESLIVQVYGLIIDRATKLSDGEYMIDQAKESFNNIAVGNGWVT